MYRVAIIAAMEREVAHLVRGWKALHDGVPSAYRKFGKDQAIVVCSGIGERVARRSAEGLVDLYKPELLISAGLGGALVPELKVGDVLVPGEVIDGATGTKYASANGDMKVRLITTLWVAGASGKGRLARDYSAQLVDMEAAAVAGVAKHHGIEFMAVKAVSDELEFDVPDFAPYVDAQGRFLTSKFAAFAVLHPGTWGRTLRLGSNTARATRELCVVLGHLIEKLRAGERAAPAALIGKGTRT